MSLTVGQLALRDRARRYTREVLQPLELDFERAGGRIDADVRRSICDASIEAGLVGGSLPTDVGGQGWSMLEQVVVHEQLGQSTGGLWSFIPGAYNALMHADADQRRRYLEPSLRGERFGVRTPPAPVRRRGSNGPLGASHCAEANSVRKCNTVVAWRAIRALVGIDPVLSYC